MELLQYLVELSRLTFLLLLVVVVVERVLLVLTAVAVQVLVDFLALLLRHLIVLMQ
jgi:hypothetical protein